MKKMILTIQDLQQAGECVFFDAAQSGTVNDASYFFSNPHEVIEAKTLDEVVPAFEKIERLSSRYWLAGYVRYEAAAAFLPQKIRNRFAAPSRHAPLVWFGAYSNPMGVDAFDPRGSYTPLRSLKPQFSYREYQKALGAIKKEIQLGNTYQVNFTVDFLFESGASPEFLYAYLRDYQRTPYCAFIKNKNEQVLSFSPELFFHRDGSRICTRPMKGTAARGADDENDAFQKEALRADEKNRAENLMIVDLLRNDLGRVAQPGTVRVPSMFDVETHPTLHQMTSLIEAQLKPGLGYQDIFSALFPCGSVTGAPKIKTMEIIQQLEQGARGIYCGAIGYIAPDQKAVFSVPIRILQKQINDENWQYRAGSGIVWDSQTSVEWDEVNMKASFLTAGEMPDGQLLETMLWADGAISFENEHKVRLRCSAKKFNFSFQESDLNTIMVHIKSALRGQPRVMVRLLMKRSGELSFECRPLELNVDGDCYEVSISDICLDRSNEWLQYKTTYRPWYENAMKRIQSGKVWDELFFNQQGELCEGARSNVFIEKDGRLYTPPLSCGLLSGIFRAHLLKSKTCFEKVITRQDLDSADAVYCGNSVRGLVKVKVTSNE